jgi:hypothetical protein
MSPQDEIVNKISDVRWQLLKLPTTLRKVVDKDLLTLQNKINKWK